MNIIMPRRAALARAAVLAGIARAKASAAAPRPSATPPPAADDAWRKVIENLKRKGAYAAENPPIPATFGLEDRTGDDKAEHAVDRINAFGEIDEQGRFQAEMVGISSEKWTRAADGNWSVDTWIFEADVYGVLHDAAHLIRAATPDQAPVSVKADKLVPRDPRIKAKYDEMTRHWAQARP
jgi:hypothetical protein